MKKKELSQNITILERIVMFLIISNVPIIFILRAFIMSNFSWEEVNAFKIVSITYSIIITTLFILQLIFNKSYLGLLMGCHQKQSRTFAFDYLGLCARCSGILIGFFLMILISFLKINMLYLLIGAIPLLLDGIIQRFTKYRSNNFRRLITGVFFGPALMVVTSYFYLYSGKLIVFIARFFV